MIDFFSLYSIYLHVTLKSLLFLYNDFSLYEVFVFNGSPAIWISECKINFGVLSVLFLFKSSNLLERLMLVRIQFWVFNWGACRVT